MANAATVAPSADTLDGKVHLTANLNNKFHRATEAETTERVLRAIFHNDAHFAVHPALPQVAMFGDEGAANHNRLGGDYGVNRGYSCLFTGGKRVVTLRQPATRPDRRWRQAKAVARLNQVNPVAGDFCPAEPACDRPGVFHNDVIAVSNRRFCSATSRRSPIRRNSSPRCMNARARVYA